MTNSAEVLAIKRAVEMAKELCNSITRPVKSRNTLDYKKTLLEPHGLIKLR